MLRMATCVYPEARVPDRLLAEPDAASVIRASTRTVRRLAEDGVLTRVKVRSLTRYRESEVLAVVRDGAPPPRRRAAGAR
jgi:hypothetical protein